MKSVRPANLKPISVNSPPKVLPSLYYSGDKNEYGSMMQHRNNEVP